MKKMFSLAAMFVALSYASPASAEVTLNGEVGLRLRDDFGNTTSAANVKANTEDQYLQYRVRLKPSADLGEGYFVKALFQNEGVAGGWNSLSANNTEQYQIEASQFFFGHADASSHWVVGRIPLNSLDNPILDLTLYAIPGTGPQGTKLYAVDTPIYTNHFDRLVGFNYGTKIGDGELNAVVVNFDNVSTPTTATSPATTDHGLFNDGYGFTVNYKANIGDVTFVPQGFVTLTHLADGRAPYSFGTQAFIPAGKSKISLSGFYTGDSNTGVQYVAAPNTTIKYDYSGYIFRVKGESGPVLAWVDYNRTKDNANTITYNNTFVWAQYVFKVQESNKGTFTLQPTIRYRASGSKTDAGVSTTNDLFRTELYATVSF
jgi:hypothetical protein